MNNHDYKQTAYYLIYLIKCILNHKIPSNEKLDEIDLSQLYEVAQKHSLTAMVAFALESAGIQDERFLQAKSKSIQRTLYFKIERTAVLLALEKSEIWYMPLKGIIISELYPKVSMREMADNDILFDSSRVDDIKQIMNNRGFIMEQDDSGHDLVFMKKPVYNFEMHTNLFGIGHDEKFNQYYENVKDRLIKDSTSNFGFHFSVEDFYIFMIAHEYKHFYQGGTGLRSLVDTYIYINQYGEALNRKYIDAELNKLGIKEYENKSRNLALALFNGICLSDDEKTLLDYYIFSGTYGNIDNLIKNKLNKDNVNKAQYAIRRLFLPMEMIREHYPLFYNHPILIPLLPLYRIITHTSLKRIINEFKTLIKLQP